MLMKNYQQFEKYLQGFKPEIVHIHYSTH